MGATLTATRVVLVDDDDDLLFTTGLALKSGGFDTVAFRSCDAAADALKVASWRPKAVLLDMHLAEGMSPAAFVVWMRDHGLADVPVLLISGAPEAPDAARAMGASGCLSKPFGIPELLKRVTALSG